MRLTSAVLAVPVALLTLRVASSPTANLSYLLLAVYALTGRAQAVQALALSWLFSMLNPALVPEASQSSSARYAVLCGAALSILARSRWTSPGARLHWPLCATVMLGAFLLVHSFLISQHTDISVLKALSWTVAAATLFSAWRQIGPDGRRTLSNQIFGGLAVLMLVSLPLLVSPSGYFVNGSGFQGALNHPQAFGPAMALLGAWAASKAIQDARLPLHLGGLALASAVLVVLSEARTAGMALSLGLFCSVVAIRMTTKRPLARLLPGLAGGRAILAAALGAFGVLLAGTSASEVVTSYIAKRSESQNLSEAYFASRGALIDDMLHNIEEDPLGGIGFGVASIPGEMEVVRDPVLGLPVAASVEKGVMLLAVAEELGVLGLLIVCCWLWTILRAAARSGFVPLTVAVTVVLLNFGEATLFSPGGFGLITLVLLAWSASGSTNESTSPVAAGPAARTFGSSAIYARDVHLRARNSVTCISVGYNPLKQSMVAPVSARHSDEDQCDESTGLQTGPRWSAVGEPLRRAARMSLR